MAPDKYLEGEEAKGPEAPPAKPPEEQREAEPPAEPEAGAENPPAQPEAPPAKQPEEQLAEDVKQLKEQRAAGFPSADAQDLAAVASTQSKTKIVATAYDLLRRMRREKVEAKVAGTLEARVANFLEEVVPLLERYLP